MGRQSLKVVAVTLTVLAAVAVAAAAQDQPPQAPRAPRAPEPPQQQYERQRAFTFDFGPGDHWSAFQRRGRLGILVDLTADAARDSIGARVAGVTPNGPADGANVRTGDIVVRINGTRLAALAGRADTPDDQSRPGLRLIEIASRLDQGDTVRLELRRDNRPMTVTFQAGESDADVIVQRFREAMPFMGEKLQMSPFEGAGGRVSIRALAGISEALADLELVKVNAGLGEYFGTAEGLLVVDTPDSSSLGLRAGDVILTIGGRRPTSPAHAMRILGTYDAGESVAFEVMRQKHRITVNGRMPAEDHRWRTIHNSLELLPVTPLLPSVAPTAPSAPAVPLMPELPHRSSVVRIVMDEEV